MEILDKILLTSHIGIGSLSLFLFWIPVIVKKGGNLHIKVGWAYTYCMWYVLLSAFLLSIINLSQGYYMIAAFLGFLAVLTGEALWYAIAILKHKKDIPDQMLRIRKFLRYVILIGGIALIVWCILEKFEGMAILLFIFGIIGVSGSAPALFYNKEVNKSWLSEHIQGMIASGIAAYTAFFAFGASSLFGSIFQGPLIAIPWILPSIIGTVIIIRMKRKNNLKFNQ